MVFFSSLNLVVRNGSIWLSIAQIFLCNYQHDGRITLDAPDLSYPLTNVSEGVEAICGHTEHEKVRVFVDQLALFGDSLISTSVIDLDVIDRAVNFLLAFEDVKHVWHVSIIVRVVDVIVDHFSFTDGCIATDDDFAALVPVGARWRDRQRTRIARQLLWLSTASSSHSFFCNFF